MITDSGRSVVRRAPRSLDCGGSWPERNQRLPPCTAGTSSRTPDLWWPWPRYAIILFPAGINVNVVLISTYELGRQPFGLASPAAWLSGRGARVTCLDLSREAFRDEPIRSEEHTSELQSPLNLV